MNDHGARNLVLLVASVWALLLGFYGFLAYRARLWSPLWAIEPTTFLTHFPERPLREEASPAERGRQLYRQLRCGVCHGPNGEGGVKNPNADPDQKVPNLFNLSEAFTRKDLKDKLLKGAHPAKLEEAGPEPPLDMPSWEKALAPEELENLTDYLFSLKPPPEGKAREEK